MYDFKQNLQTLRHYEVLSKVLEWIDMTTFWKMGHKWYWLEKIISKFWEYPQHERSKASVPRHKEMEVQGPKQVYREAGPGGQLDGALGALD